MTKTKSRKKAKVIGRTVIDASRRHNADQGGRNPLTAFPLVPVGCVVSMELLQALKTRSDQFINPINYRPYGVTALSRILCQIMMDQIDRYYEMDYLAYMENKKEGTPGKASLGGNPKKIPLLIPKPIVERVNEKVMAFNNPLIGTSTIVRFLIEKGLKKAKIEDIYKFVPAKHMSLMITKRLTISDLQKRFKLEQASRED